MSGGSSPTPEEAMCRLHPGLVPWCRCPSASPASRMSFLALDSAREEISEGREWLRASWKPRKDTLLQ